MLQLSDLLRDHAILLAWEAEAQWTGEAEEWGEKWYYNPLWLALFRLELEYWETSRETAQRLEDEGSPLARIAWAVSDRYLPM